MRSWCIGEPSASYVAKMEDVLDVYARPYDPRRPVVCFDEGAKELRVTPRGSLPPLPGIGAVPGTPEREDFEYERLGKTNLMLWVEPLTGRRKVRLCERRTRIDFAEQLRPLAEEDFPEAQVIALVVDNLNTHGPAALYERFEPEVARRIARRLEWHYTPGHGSWLNIAEVELSVLHRQCLSRRIAPEEIGPAVAAWEAERNQRQVTVDWQFTTEDARLKLRRLYPVYPVVKERTKT